MHGVPLDTQGKRTSSAGRAWCNVSSWYLNCWLRSSGSVLSKGTLQPGLTAWDNTLQIWVA